MSHIVLKQNDYTCVIEIDENPSDTGALLSLIEARLPTNASGERYVILTNGQGKQIRMSGPINDHEWLSGLLLETQKTQQTKQEEQSPSFENETEEALSNLAYAWPTTERNPWALRLLLSWASIFFRGEERIVELRRFVRACKINSVLGDDKEINRAYASDDVTKNRWLTLRRGIAMAVVHSIRLTQKKTWFFLLVILLYAIFG